MLLVDLPVLQQLSREEQLELVADLWDFLAARPDDDLQPVSSEEATLLNQRLAAHEAAPKAARALDDFGRQLASRL